jgi:release factor glutamine methyltransferase
MKEFLRRILIYSSLNTLNLLNIIFAFSFCKRIKDKIFYFTPDVFSPQFFVFSSTFFINNMFIPKGSTVLDIGTGSGILAIFAAEKAQQVVATDINPDAIKNARINIKLNGLTQKIELRSGNLFRQIEEKFDIILFNPPYYPLKPKTYLEAAWCGGRSYTVLRNFLKKAKNYLTPNGLIQISLSSYMHLNFIKKLIHKHKFTPILLARKFLFFEILYLYLLIPKEIHYDKKA